jgi:uncharacterized membrane protein
MGNITVQVEAEAVATHLSDMVGTAIKDAVGSWALRDQVRAVVEQAIVGTNLPALLGAELERRLSELAPSIVTEVGDDVVPFLKVAFAGAFRAALVSMVFGLKAGKPAYMSKQDADRWNEAQREVLGQPPAEAHETLV